MRLRPGGRGGSRECRVAFLVALSLLTPGHFWGDDWTLYVRQAEV